MEKIPAIAIHDGDDQIARLSAIIDGGSGVDLHSHSRHSDGDWLPADLIADAHRIGLALVSLTDHDTVAGQMAARDAADEAGMLFLTGMEVSLKVEERLYHVLCYDFDPTAPTWHHFAVSNRANRERYQLDQFAQMQERGYAISPDLARNEDGLFLPHPLAVALHRAGRAESIEAAQRMIQAMALRPRIELTYHGLAEFSELLQPGDAVFSVAHPARHQSGVSVRLNEADLLTLKASIPLVALEATHPYHSSADVAHFAQLAARNGLAVTCGSDAHGERMRRPLQHLPASLCTEFLGIIRDRWQARVPRPLVALTR